VYGKLYLPTPVKRDSSWVVLGIFATPVKDNLLEWLAEVQGLKDSLWEGAVLQLSIKYTDEYNNIPPTVTFNTIPFHPNVDQNSGRPCIDFLDNPKEWNGKLTMSSILLAIQVMLSNPELENAVNVEAAEMLKNNISLYRQMVIQCVRTSQHPEGSLIQTNLSLGHTRLSLVQIKGFLNSN
uniref:Ubiquitin conjugating enzyme E2 U n=1 Tax=Pelusios castaneus TaxID=367368 RepID=A0A8C8VQ72_9SAUR